MIQVGRDHMTGFPHFGFDQEREIRRARSDVERPSVRDSRDIGGGQAFPAVVETEAQEGIIEVIDAGDRREHSLDGLLARLSRPCRHHLRWAVGPAAHGRFPRSHHSRVVAPAFHHCQAIEMLYRRCPEA
jgi:hypothetical protein